jgi:DNA invertase Pin-like site-specific DNA recombinase
MANGKFIAYYRVSTPKQGQSGLGLEAQKQAVSNYLNGGDWKLINEFTEVETGKGADALDRRPELKAAIEACRKQKATLVIAVLDRLGRNVHFISGLMESGIDFISVESPNDSPFMLHVKAAVAEEEGRKISARTKAALQAAKARGVVLGAAGAANLKPNIEQRQKAADEFAGNLKGYIESMKSCGLSQRDMCDELNKLGVPTARGGQWSQIQLQRVMARF